MFFWRRLEKNGKYDLLKIKHLKSKMKHKLFSHLFISIKRNNTPYLCSFIVHKLIENRLLNNTEPLESFCNIKDKGYRMVDLPLLYTPQKALIFHTFGLILGMIVLRT